MSVQNSFSKLVRSRVYLAVTSLATMIGIGTWLFHTLEKWTWAESFYFSVATLTTVGYGDLHPTSDSSRVATAIFILIGVAIAITALTSIGSAYVEKRDKLMRQVMRKK